MKLNLTGLRCASFSKASPHWVGVKDRFFAFDIFFLTLDFLLIIFFRMSKLLLQTTLNEFSNPALEVHAKGFLGLGGGIFLREPRGPPALARQIHVPTIIRQAALQSKDLSSDHELAAIVIGGFHARS
jgi:hypothetical protein